MGRDKSQQGGVAGDGTAPIGACFSGAHRAPRGAFYFPRLACFSARFSFRFLAGFFFASFFWFMPLLIDILLVDRVAAAMRSMKD